MPTGVGKKTILLLGALLLTALATGLLVLVEPPAAAQASGLSLKKRDDPDPVFVGQTLTYTLEVVNNGTDSANNVTTTDILPSGVTFVSVSPEDRCTQSSGTITCNLGNLERNARATVTIRVTPTQPGEITNRASASANNRSTVTATASTTVQSPLSLTKTDSPDPVTVGQNLAYTLTVANRASDKAEDVTITDTLPNGVTFVSVSSSQGNCTRSELTVTCKVGELDEGQSATVTIVVRPAQARTTTNTASVSAKELDTVIASEQTTIRAADLSITKEDAPDPVPTNDGFSYTLRVSNAAGAANATNVRITDTLPDGVTLDGSLPTDCKSTGTNPVIVTCELGTVNAEQTVNKTINVTAPSTPGTLENRARVTSPNDPTPNDSNLEQTTVVAEANLSINKTDNPDPVLVNGNFTYTFTVTNAAGAGTATNVQIKDTLPEGVTLNGKPPDNCSSTGTGAAGNPVTMTCKLPNLRDRASDSVSINVRAPNTPGTLNNTATVNSDTDPGSPKTSNDQQTTVEATADLSITKEDTPDPVPVNGNFSYTLCVGNATGAGTATNVRATDNLPDGVTLNGSLPTDCTSTGTNPVAVTCELGTVNAGQTVSRTINVTAPGTPGTISNTATVSSPRDHTNSSDTEETAVVAEADLSVTKNDDPDPVLAGEDLTYTITVTNEGPNTATAVSAEDTLPAGVAFESAAPSQGSCSESGGVVTCDLDDLGSGATATVEIVVQPMAAGSIENTAKVSGTTDDPNRGNNRTMESTTMRTEEKQPPKQKQPPVENTPVSTGSTMMSLLMQNSVGCHARRPLGELASACRTMKRLFVQSSGDQASSFAEEERPLAVQEQPPAENVTAEEEQASSSEQVSGGQSSAEHSSSPEDTRAEDSVAAGSLPTISGLYRPVDQLSDARRAADGPLPDTGGLSFLIPATALLLIGFGVLILAVKRRYF